MQMGKSGIKTEEEVWLSGLMDDVGGRLTKLAFSYLNDWGKAQEVVQDVFYVCYTKRRHVLELDSIEAWLYRVTVNRCKDVLRTSWFKKVIVNNDLFHYQKSAQPSPEIAAVTKGGNEKLAQLVLGLPVKYKEVILLFYYDDLSIEEISYVLKSNSNTVKTRLKRGREALMKNMERSDFLERSIDEY
ncbi:sigma-70 family RNA polymerase sigma factor [Sporosarcina sp. Sa2YVA2]|uniref:Sigma-70 family RNA polymerase sigma factor n=1 Tax=Sporosarcina quadrami TaxID=2762234 RepID=A0ABR8UAW2_9BACL|nr:sigma-70 family RNA polymerase sigma factor [Sporosarcina quadrami]MBD7984889.1 sigma-70 family RNA polymerase sigma factor [Sporosarcina quadrami]